MVIDVRALLAGSALLGTVGVAAASSTAPTQICRNPDALGVSRSIDVGGAAELGLKTYPQTLDLEDHEVVLTFDDGPSRATTPAVLDALAHECVRATFFLIGRSAEAAPDLVRRERADGHTVGHHTWDHPSLTLRNMAGEKGIEDIEHGMRADDLAGYGAWTGEPRVPFFRYPGFGFSAETRAWLKLHRITVFGADLWASDWVPMTPDAELDLLLGRLRSAGRGIILLHDIKRQTAEMLPRFLAALKAEHFRVVQIVAAGNTAPTRPAPHGWTSETEHTLDHMWPKARADAPPRPASAGQQPADPLPLRTGEQP